MADERPRASPIQVPRPERQITFRTGISAESRAAMFLVAKGFRILARRWKSPVGEIDIIARRRSLLVFVEVKARDSLDDAAVACAAAQVSGQTFLDLVLVRGGIGREEVLGGDDHAGNAESALHGAAFDKRLLDRIELPTRRLGNVR